MILSFKDKKTQLIWEGKAVRSFDMSVQKTARRKLRMLHSALNINDIRVPPANKLKKLKGGMKDQWSIRINDQWRICFRFKNNHCSDVHIVDYHS